MMTVWSNAGAEDRTVRASLNTELRILDTIVAMINATRVFAYMVYDMLVGIDNEGRYHPQMLDGWQISDDRMTYTFRLRDGLAVTCVRTNCERRCSPLVVGGYFAG
jgi:peptide/nickel transport system substrate-binding protein